jgi:hypothetical protein
MITREKDWNEGKHDKSMTKVAHSRPPSEGVVEASCFD